MNKINQMEPWIDKEEKRAMMEYLDSGGWLTEHKKTKEFEQMIADYIGCKHVCAVTNGTMALMIALMALDIKRYEEIIVPNYSMIASANAIRLVKATPVFVDSDKTNLCLDMNLVEEAITSRTKAIMLVTINGRCPDMYAFMDLAHDKKLFLVEDACQSLGSRYDDIHLGTFGDIGCFSFSSAKVISTGQGGCLVTDSDELHKKTSMIKNFGRSESGVDYYEMMGLNAKSTDLQAVIGIEQMKKLDWRVNRKKEIYRLYRTLLKDVEGVEFVDTNLKDTSPWFIDILVDADKRDKLIAFLDMHGIGTRPFYPAIHTQPPYSWVKGNFPVAEEISNRGVWLPSSSFLSDKEIKYVCQKVKMFFL